MKPVTEDQVQMLLSGLGKREKAALLALDRETKAASTASGRMTANVFRIKSSLRNVVPNGETDVVDIGARRRQQRRRITSKGFFFYAPEPRVSGSP